MLHRFAYIFYEHVLFFRRLESVSVVSKFQRVPSFFITSCPVVRLTMLGPGRSNPRRAFALQRRRTRGKWLSQRRRLGKARK